VTPAQAYGHPDWITDFPVQGPTDPGIRAADCWYAQNRLPVNNPACADCKGPIPMWAQTKGTGLSESISFGGHRAVGFGAASDPEIFSKLTSDQQSWVRNAMNDLNSKIIATTGTTCPGWGTGIQQMAGCFQLWYNANLGASTKMLRTDGVVDQDTLDALKALVAARPGDFPSAPLSATPATPKTGLSTGEMIGIAAGVAALIGGGAYLATRKKKKGR